jgi:hypothetical protein
MALETVIALFNIVVGLMLVGSVLLMIGGLILWYVRLGTYPTYRDQAIEMMEWAVAILFVLAVLLGIAQFVQTHMALAMMLIGAAVALVVLYAVGSSFFAGGEEEHEHK